MRNTTVGTKEEITLYKDLPCVNHRSKIKMVLKHIAEHIKKSKAEGVDEQAYRKKWLFNNQISSTKHKPKHTKCAGCDTDTITEKRICRCMYYYSPDSISCKSCRLKHKWNNIGEIKILNHEVPTKYKYDKVGGIDLIFNDEKREIKYAVEVKPMKSQESIGRMFAEIWTYTTEPDEDDKIFTPAICFFDSKDNVQRNQFFRLLESNNDDLRYITDYIKVFYFEGDFDKMKDVVDFKIKPIEEHPEYNK